MPKLRSYQAIVTKYIPASNTKGSRVKARAAAGSVTLSWDDSLNTEANHARAAEALACKQGWPGQWFMGGLPDDRGYCFVSSDDVETPAFRTAGR